MDFSKTLIVAMLMANTGVAVAQDNTDIPAPPDDVNHVIDLTYRDIFHI